MSKDKAEEDESSKVAVDDSIGKLSLPIGADLTPSDEASQVVRSGEESIADNPNDVYILRRIPNTTFGISMGLAGNAAMWKVAGNADFTIGWMGSVNLANSILWYIALIVTSMTMLAYVYKIVFNFQMLVMEFNHPIRVHFFNAPHLILIILSLGVPGNMQVSPDLVGMQIIFAIGLVIQFCLTQVIYERWMCCNKSNSMSEAKPQFFLSIIGWFLLAVLGEEVDITTTWGICIPSFCFGTGCFMYIMILTNVFNGLHNDLSNKGSPALTLLIAPPSVASMAIDLLDKNPAESNVVAQMALGWALMLLTLLIKLCPRLMAMPTELGTYWAYVFPMASLSSACLKYAIVTNTTVSNILAITSIALATLALCTVFCRLMYHTVLCCQHKARWGDPLLGISSNNI